MNSCTLLSVLSTCLQLIANAMILKRIQGQTICSGPWVLFNIIGNQLETCEKASQVCAAGAQIVWGRTPIMSAVVHCGLLAVLQTRVGCGRVDQAMEYSPGREETIRRTRGGRKTNCQDYSIFPLFHTLPSPPVKS